MWFLGAIIGALLGATLGKGVGFVLGTLIGGYAGWFLEQRMSGLEAQIKALAARLDRLEKSVPSGVAPEVVAAPAALAPDAPPPIPAVAPPPKIAPPEEIPAAPALGEPGPVAAAAPRPSQPEFWERLVGGNLVAKAGIIILFFGVAFLLRYAYDRIYVPVEMRLIAAACGALVLLAVGWRLRARRAGYALALQGGGIGILYLVIFGAFRMFHLLPAVPSFALLIVIAASSAVLSVAQSSLALAVIGASGGFLAPVLTSTGQGSHVMLFSYYAVLNAGIFAIAWLQAWRVLNLLGFVFTFVIGWVWGVFAYRPEFFATTEPFLVLFFLMYVAIPVLFARRRSVELKDYVDGTLVFGVPLVAFGLQTALVDDTEYGAAWSALALAAFYLSLAVSLFRGARERMRLLIESYLALSLAFATLAIPLALDGRLTSAAWALEGAAVVWIGVRQVRVLARTFGYALQLAAGIAFLWEAGRVPGATPVLNSFYLGCLFVAAGALFCSGYIDRNRDRLRSWETGIALALMAWGSLWWYGGGIHEIMRHVDPPYRTQAVLLFFTASSVAFSVISRALPWRALGWLWLAFYPAMLMQAGLDVLGGAHPFAHIGALAWAVAFAAHFWLAARHAADDAKIVEGVHAAGVWLLALVAARELGWQIDALVEGKRVWPSISWAIGPAAMLAAMTGKWLRERWPVSAFPRGYLLLGAAPLAAFLVLWTAYANITNDGDPYPLPYIPVLNPLDVAVGAVFVVVAVWLSRLAAGGLWNWWQTSRAAVLATLGAAAFIWVNGTLLRTIHHWTGLAFALDPMLSSTLVQACLSILWTSLALGAMVAATRRALRPLWVVGAVLMAVVVAKLILVDMSGSGTVERIISFMGVGLLMLVVGYFSPVPPRQEAKP